MRQSSYKATPRPMEEESQWSQVPLHSSLPSETSSYDEQAGAGEPPRPSMSDSPSDSRNEIWSRQPEAGKLGGFRIFRAYGGRSGPPDGDVYPPTKQPDGPGVWLFSGLVGIAATYTLFASFGYAIEIRRWPLGLSLMIVVLLAVYAFQQFTLVQAHKACDRGWKHRQEHGSDDEYSPRATRATVLATASFAAFLLGAYLFSYLVATAVFVPAYMYLARIRRPLVLVGVTAGMLVAVWAMFGALLHAPVETGLLIRLDWLAL